MHMLFPTVLNGWLLLDYFCFGMFTSIGVAIGWFGVKYAFEKTK